MNANDFDDYWVQSSKAAKAPVKPALQIDTIDGVEPLDAQLGVAALKTVPDALYQSLFGQPSAVALHTYAILDAAKVPNLPEVLETSGLEHRCLFKGGAYDTLKGVAPWIVQLQDENAFTRNLFTQSDAPWHLWDNEPGIYLRSNGTLDEIWSHFRKFTKVRDEQGNWGFFRFWHPATAQIYFAGVQSDEMRINPFFCLPRQQRLGLVALTSNGRALHMVGPVAAHDLMQPQMVPFDQSDRRLLDNVAYRGLSLEIGNWLKCEYVDRFDQLDPQPAADHIVETGRQLGLQLKEEFAFLGQMMATSGAWFVHNGYPVKIRALLQGHAATRLRDLVNNYAIEHAKTPQAAIMKHWVDVQRHLAAIPLVDSITPQQFRMFCEQFLGEAAPDVEAAIAGTRSKLRTLNLGSQRKEGKAMILSLIYGPRFFEDPFYAWSQLKAEEAIDVAWTIIVE